MKMKVFIAALFLLTASVHSQTATNIFPTPTGNVGIGISPPTARLEVYAGTFNHLGQNPSVKNVARFSAGSLSASTKYSFDITETSTYLSDKSTKLQTFNGSATPRCFIDFDTKVNSQIALSFGYGTSTAMQILDNNRVRIGDVPTPPNYKLFVELGILTEKLKVAIKTTADWSDYVFAPEYRLRPLDEVAEFIKNNGHLPEVPSAEEMVTEGLDVAKMDAKLLSKIEELTLYAIEQDNENKGLKAEMAQLEQQVTEQKREMAEVKAQLKALLAQKQ